METVLLFGSWAARNLGEPGRVPNDIDVLVIGRADRDDVEDAAERAERRIGLPVQASVRTRKQWDAQADSFIKELRVRPFVAVLEPEPDQARPRGRRASSMAQQLEVMTPEHPSNPAPEGSPRRSVRLYLRV